MARVFVHLLVFFLLPVLFLLSLLFSTSFREVFVGFKLTDWVGLIGLYLGVVGTAFSYIAVIKVSELSDRYFIKITFPSSSRRLVKISKELPALADVSSNELVAEAFFAEVPVILRSITRAKASGLRAVVRSALNAHKRLNTWMLQQENFTSQVRACQHFWELISQLAEVSEEIKMFMKEEEAK